MCRRDGKVRSEGQARQRTLSSLTDLTVHAAQRCSRKLAALVLLQVAAARREAASQASATEAAVQRAREAATREQAALAAKVAAAEEAAAAARQEAEELRQRRLREMEGLQARFGGLLQVGGRGAAGGAA